MPPDPPDGEAAATASSSTEAHAIRLEREAVVGRKHKLMLRETMKNVETKTTDGVANRRATTTNATLVAIHTTKEVDDRGRETVAEYAVERLTVGESRGPRRLLEGGVVIQIRRAEDKKDGSVTSDTTLDEETTTLLGSLLRLRVSRKQDDKMFGTTVPQAVGGTWSVDGETVRDSAKEAGVPFVMRAFDGTLSVLKEETVGGHPCLAVGGTIKTKIDDLPTLPPEFTQRSGELELKVWGMFPTDLSLPRLASRQETRFKFEASGTVEGKKVVVEIENEQIRSSEIELL